VIFNHTNEKRLRRDNRDAGVFFCASGDEDKSVPPFAKTNLFSKKFAFAREFC